MQTAYREQDALWGTIRVLAERKTCVEVACAKILYEGALTVWPIRTSFGSVKLARSIIHHRGASLHSSTTSSSPSLQLPFLLISVIFTRNQLTSDAVGTRVLVTSHLGITSLIQPSIVKHCLDIMS